MTRTLTNEARQSRKGPPQIREGTVLSTPVSADQPVWVTIDLDDEETPRGPCPWAPRDGGGMPVKGDPCLIATSDVGHHWLVMWWPFGPLTADYLDPA